MKKTFLPILALLVLLGGIYLGYTSLKEKPTQQQQTDTTEEIQEDQTTGVPNPASVYCKENGGTLEIKEEELGQVGYCYFEDGSYCEEWAYYRDECNVGENM